MAEMWPVREDGDAYVRPRQRLDDSAIVGDEWVATEPALVTTPSPTAATRRTRWSCVLILCVAIYVLSVLVWDSATVHIHP